MPFFVGFFFFLFFFFVVSAEPPSSVLLRLGFSYTHDELYPATGLLHPSYMLAAPAWFGAARPPRAPEAISSVAATRPAL